LALARQLVLVELVELVELLAQMELEQVSRLAEQLALAHLEFLE